jgi:hypothetical protein
VEEVKNAFKKFRPMSLSSPELSLFFQNVGGSLDASGSMKNAPVVLKASSLTFYNSLSFPSFSSLCLFNFASFLLALSFNRSKALIASSLCNKRYT